MARKWPWCCFETGVRRAVDGGGWYWEKCDYHTEIPNARKLFYERRDEQIEEMRKKEAPRDAQD